MTQITEENLKTESATLELKREYKYALENLARVKSDTNDILAIKDKARIEVDERNKDLTKVLNDIANAKLIWLQEQNEAWDKVSKKESEADNIIKRKVELNKQEEEIRKIEANNILARDEARRIEFKNEQTATAFEVRENELKNHYKEIKRREDKLVSDHLNFKEQVVNVLSKVHEINI